MVGATKAFVVKAGRVEGQGPSGAVAEVLDHQRQSLEQDYPDSGSGGDILGDHPHAADGDKEEPVVVGVLGPIAALNSGIIGCPENTY